MKNARDSQKSKRQLERMYSGHLVCCNHVRELFGTLPQHGALINVGGDDNMCHHEQHDRDDNIYDGDWNSRVSWLSHRLGQHLRNTCCICIIRYGIIPPMTVFKPI
jgi:hypothetical protein